MIALLLLVLLGQSLPEACETDSPVSTHALSLWRSYVR